MLLTVEYEGDGKETGVVDIHFDEEGAELLATRLLVFIRRGERGHDHVMTLSWAGVELTERKVNSRAELVNKQNLRFWPTGIE